MAEVSAKDVAALRKETGAGMMDCKRALQETGGDFEAAKIWLREKGLAGAQKRGGRVADQGAVDVAVVGNVGAVVELNCETDFVAKGDEFRATVAQLAQQAAADASELGAQAYAGGPDTVDTTIKALGGKLGENIQLGRVVRLDADGGVVDAYKHIQNERGVIGVLVVLGGVDPSGADVRDVAHDVALHVASAAPGWTRREDVPATWSRRSARSSRT
jgi:elongation factor Ts